MYGHIMSTYTKMLKQGETKQFLLAIGRNSNSSKTSYAVALKHFNDFLESNGYTLKDIIRPLKTNKINIYELLDEFITYLQEQKNGNMETLRISVKSIKAYMAAIRSYLGYKDIDIVSTKFKQRVKMPKVIRKDEESLDAADIREILLHCSNRRLKPYLLILASAGPRTIEAASLRLCDILDLENNRIDIRGEFTKTKEARYSFISDEAVKFVKELIEWKYRTRRTDKAYRMTRSRNDEDLVFGTKLDTVPRHIYQRLRIEFNKVLASINRDKRKEGAQRRKITLNSLRRFAKSVVSEQASSDYSEWLIGHAKSSYWVKKPHEKLEIYKTKCMKYLTFLDYTVLEATGKNIEAKLQEKESEIQSMKIRYEQDMKVMREEMNQQFNQIMSMIQQNPKLAQIKPEALSRKKM